MSNTSTSHPPDALLPSQVPASHDPAHPAPRNNGSASSSSTRHHSPPLHATPTAPERSDPTTTTRLPNPHTSPRALANQSMRARFSATSASAAGGRHGRGNDSDSDDSSDSSRHHPEDPDAAPRGLFETFFRSERIGPVSATRFHRASLWRRVLHLLFTFSLIGGTVFGITVMLCVMTTIGYLAFVVRTDWVLITAAIVFYGFIVLSMSRTFLRTSLRILIFIWTSSPRPISGKARTVARSEPTSLVTLFIAPAYFASRWLDTIVRWSVDHLYEYNRRNAKRRETASPSSYPGVLSQLATDGRAETGTAAPVAAAATYDSSTTRSSSQMSEQEEKQQMRDQLRHALLFLALVLLLLIPSLYLAATMGYNAVVSLLSFAVIFGATVAILATNAWNRLHRTGRFLALLWKGGISPERRRAMFVASAGQETKMDIRDALATKLAIVIACILVVGLIFRRKSAPVVPYLVLGATVLVLILFRCRATVTCGWLKTDPNQLGWYNGKGWREPLIAMAARALFILVGFTAVMYLDLSDIQEPGAGAPIRRVIDLFGDSPSNSSLVVLGVGFMVFYLVQDLSLLLVNVVSSQVAVVLISVSLIAKVALASVIAKIAGGYTGSASIVLAYLAFDIRDGRALWTDRGHLRGNRSYQRSAVNAMITFSLLVLAVVSSLALGYLVNFKRDAETTLADVAWPTEASLIAQSASPMCNIRYGPDAQLSVFDMATLAAAPYRKTAADAREFVQSNPRLRALNVSLEFFDEMDKSGVKFVEFRVPTTAPAQQPVSVVSIRGTANVEDILQDMYVWSTPGLIQFSSYFGTLSRLWPREVTATVVHFISKYVAHTTLLYDVEVDKYVTRLMREGRHVIVTGHSLGGGIASIVGARNRIPALALSSPGLGFSYLNYQITWDDLSRWVVNVVPYSDPVPMADEQVSTVMHIPCSSKAPVECHRWRRTLNTLIDTCYYDIDGSPDGVPVKTRPRPVPGGP